MSIIEGILLGLLIIGFFIVMIVLIVMGERSEAGPREYKMTPPPDPPMYSYTKKWTFPNYGCGVVRMHDDNTIKMCKLGGDHEGPHEFKYIRLEEPNREEDLG